MGGSLSTLRYFIVYSGWSLKVKPQFLFRVVSGELLLEWKREKASRLGTKDHIQTHGFLFTSLNRLYTKHTHTGIATRISQS